MNTKTTRRKPQQVPISSLYFQILRQTLTKYIDNQIHDIYILDYSVLTVLNTKDLQFITLLMNASNFDKLSLMLNNFL